MRSPTMFSLAVAALGASSSMAAVSLDPTNADQLAKATKSALTNLMTYYTPNEGGTFDQTETPWHESGMIWGMFMDYTKWSGDTSFMNTVTGALVNASYKTQQDFLGGDLVTVLETLQGRWNDDILWPSQAVIGGAEIYGAQTTMPGANGPWFTAAQKTFDQAYEQWDELCSGGIYWSRDRNSKGALYKSLITQLEFISQGARNYIQNKNDTAMGLATKTLEWVVGPSGLGNPTTGVLLDGMNSDACNAPTDSQWSYNYGQMLGALAWMHKATGNATYLSLATPFLNQALATFAASNTSGVVTEQCEPAGNCNRDQQGFKGILLRNMVYLYRETDDAKIKSSITTAIDASVAGMIKSSCDDQWNCNGNWSTAAAPVKDVRSQYVSSALLVSAMGVHTTTTGAGLLTNVNAQQLTNTAGNSSGSSSGNSGSVESRPLGAASGVQVRVGGIVGAAALAAVALLF